MAVAFVNSRWSEIAGVAHVSAQCREEGLEVAGNERTLIMAGNCGLATQLRRYLSALSRVDHVTILANI